MIRETEASLHVAVIKCQYKPLVCKCSLSLAQWCLFFCQEYSDWDFPCLLLYCSSSSTSLLFTLHLHVDRKWSQTARGTVSWSEVCVRLWGKLTSGQLTILLVIGDDLTSVGSSEFQSHFSSFWAAKASHYSSSTVLRDWSEWTGLFYPKQQTSEVQSINNSNSGRRYVNGKRWDKGVLGLIPPLWHHKDLTCVPESALQNNLTYL